MSGSIVSRTNPGALVVERDQDARRVRDNHCMTSGFHPHDPLPAEPTFDSFVASVGGIRVSAVVGQSPTFRNADYYFRSAEVIVELKTIEEDFPRLPEYEEKFVKLRADQIHRGLATWGGVIRMEPPSPEALNEILRLYRPRLNRMLDKANTQLKETKQALSVPNATGLVIVANDRLRSLEPYFVVHLLANILMSRFSAIDGFVYVTLNQYVDLRGSDLANLLWVRSTATRHLTRSWSSSIVLVANGLIILRSELGHFRVAANLKIEMF